LLTLPFNDSPSIISAAPKEKQVHLIKIADFVSLASEFFPPDAGSIFEILSSPTTDALTFCRIHAQAMQLKSLHDSIFTSPINDDQLQLRNILRKSSNNAIDAIANTKELRNECEENVKRVVDSLLLLTADGASLRDDDKGFVRNLLVHLQIESETEDWKNLSESLRDFLEEKRGLKRKRKIDLNAGIGDVMKIKSKKPLLPLKKE
jgi:hypothetical protein